MTAIPGVGPQLARVAAGTDPRGILVFEYLPDDLQRAEDSTQAADRERRLGCGLFGSYVELKPTPGGGMRVRDTETGRLVPDGVELRDEAAAAGLLRIGWHDWHGFIRDATDAERALLEHLGHTDLPELLYTHIDFKTGTVRNRSWPQLPTLEVNP